MFEFAVWNETDGGCLVFCSTNRKKLDSLLAKIQALKLKVKVWAAVELERQSGRRVKAACLSACSYLARLLLNVS
jgi:hypothetical protein